MIVTVTVALPAVAGEMVSKAHQCGVQVLSANLDELWVEL